MGFTLKHEILHINISGLLSLQRLILEILPGEARVTCSQLFFASPLLAASLEAFAPRQGVGWAWSRAQPGATAECCPQQPCWLGRLCWVTVPRVPVWGQAQASRGCAAGLLKCDCSSTDVCMVMLPPRHEAQKDLGKHLCMEIPHQGYWWVLIYSWVEYCLGCAIHIVTLPRIHGSWLSSFMLYKRRKMSHVMEKSEIILEIFQRFSEHSELWALCTHTV